MRHFLVAVSLVLVFPQFGAAEVDPRLGRIRELVVLMQQDLALRVAIEAILNQQLAKTIQELDEAAELYPGNDALVEEKKREAIELHARLVPHFWKHVDLEAFRKEVIVPIFARHFTEHEVTALVQFYSSPVARKLLGLTPELMRASSEATARYFEPAIDRMENDLRGERDANLKVLETMSQMRSLANDIEFARLEIASRNAGLPPLPRTGSVDELRPLFEATDGRVAVPEASDGWGRPFAIVLSEGAVRVRIISAGADGVFEADSRTLSAAVAPHAAETVWSDSPGADIVHQDGYFLRLSSAVREPGERIRD